MEKIVGKYKIKIEQDTDPESPRAWDNLGVMVCFHSRYTLGDKHNYDHEDYEGWDEMEQAIIKNEKVAAILPLYLYDHSGITMSTSSFNDRWDSGQVGFIYITKKKYLSEFGGKIMTPKRTKHAEDIIRGEVETYDQYLTGDVYGFKIFELDENGKEIDEIDSCWGYYGEDECMKEAEANLPEQELTEEVKQQ